MAEQFNAGYYMALQESGQPDKAAAYKAKFGAPSASSIGEKDRLQALTTTGVKYGNEYGEGNVSISPGKDPWSVFQSMPGYSGGGTDGSGGTGGGGSPVSGGNFFAGVGPMAQGPQPGEIDMNMVARNLYGQGATPSDIMSRQIQAQQGDLDRMKRFEDEKLRLMKEQENRAYIDPKAEAAFKRGARENVRGAQAQRGVYTSGESIAQESYLMPQIEQQLRAWQLGALSDISSQLDPLIQSTATRAAMYNLQSMFS